ncbi:MAG: alpha/beta hydrolase [Actinomycetota bacterium]|nr:alpha/beta hydrolase [Actinomycetota bacterium]
MPDADTEIVKVRSRDGTTIACERTGSGPPLILVHGAGSTRLTWRPVLPLLSQWFTVYAVDRRGRGESGDAAEYALEREFEDVGAVVEATGEAASLLGHSLGGLIALEAALLTDRVARLVLYEAVTSIEKTPTEFIQRLERMVDDGEYERALVTFYQERAHLSPQEIDLVRSTPAWPDRVRAAPTLPRELDAHNAYEPRPDRFAALRVPTLLLSGTAIAEYRAAMQEMKKVIPNSRLVVFEGQGHVAHATAPEAFASEVAAFLEMG